MMPKEFNYTTGILVEWGRMSIRDANALENLAELEESILQSDSLESDLRSDLDLILEGAKQAVYLLSQEDIIGLTRDDDEWSDAADAFDILDMLVYLFQGVEHIFHKHESLIAEDILVKLETAYENASEMFFSPIFSPLRLVTFNERRRESLTAVRPEFHYLFPWHLLQNDEDSSILSTLAEHYHELNVSEKLPEAVSQNLIFYIGEIQKDRLLSQFLQDENRIAMMVKETLTVHWSFRLLRATQLEGDKRLLPEDVGKRGIGQVSRSILKQLGLSLQDRFALAVASACYAPGIEDADRVSLLLKCEEILKVDWQQYNAGTASGKLIEKLHILDAGTAGAHEVAVASLDFWFQKLESAAIVPVKSEEPMISLVNALFSPEEVVSAGEKKNIVVPFYSKIIASVDRVKEWFEFTPKFAYAVAASLVVIIVPLLFLLREPVPLSLQISMIAETYQDTLSRSNQKAAVPITVNKGVTLSADDCIQLQFKASKDVYGYLIHQNSTWTIKKYFEGKLVAGQSYQFPEEGTRACLTGKPGKEIFYLITSETPLVNFDDKILPITNPTEPIPHPDVLQVIKKLFPQAIIETFDYSFK